MRQVVYGEATSAAASADGLAAKVGFSKDKRNASYEKTLGSGLRGNEAGRIGTGERAPEEIRA